MVRRYPLLCIMLMYMSKSVSRSNALFTCTVSEYKIEYKIAGFFIIIQHVNFCNLNLLI